MAWSKGAVVIVKHGDPVMREEMGKIFEDRANVKSGSGYCFMPHRHSKEELMQMMEDAEITYGIRHKSPEWIRPIKEAIAFVTYHVCRFIEKYLIL